MEDRRMPCDVQRETARRLLSGAHQLALRYMVRHGGVWHVGCGWLWDTPEGTVRIMDSLVRRGFARKVMVGLLYDQYELV